MFPGGAARLPHCLAYDGGPRSEYIDLVRRQLRSGKVKLSGEVEAVGRIFAIAKRGTDKQRLAWRPGYKGRRLSASAARVGQPRSVGRPGSLSGQAALGKRPGCGGLL